MLQPLSKSYLAKKWTMHELRVANERAAAEFFPYIFPLLIEDVDPPSFLRTTAYEDLRRTTVEGVIEHLCNLLRKAAESHPR